MRKAQQLVVTCALVSSVLFANAAHAYTNTAMQETTPTSQFTFDTKGTATDTKTGLMWQRCPIGTGYSNAGTPANYNDDLCTNENALLSWSDALKAVQTANANLLSGYSDWRLPNLQELRSIIERRNYDPAMNLVVFPSYNSSSFWTSTPPIHTGYADSTVAIDFMSGNDNWPKRSAQVYVRLVRTAP